MADPNATKDFKTSFGPQRLLKVRDAAGLLGLSEKWLWDRIAEGALPVIKLRGATRVSLADLEAFVEKSRLIRKAGDGQSK